VLRLNVVQVPDGKPQDVLRLKAEEAEERDDLEERMFSKIHAQRIANKIEELKEAGTWEEGVEVELAISEEQATFEKKREEAKSIRNQELAKVRSEIAVREQELEINLDLSSLTSKFSRSSIHFSPVCFLTIHCFLSSVAPAC